MMFCASTIGAAPETVIVSSSVPTVIEGIDGGVEATAQLHAVALERIEPGQRERHRIHAGPQIDDAVQPPWLSLTVVRTFSISAGLAASTVAPGRTAPDSSLTTPVMLPLCRACAPAADGQSNRTDAVTTRVSRNV